MYPIQKASEKEIAEYCIALHRQNLEYYQGNRKCCIHSCEKKIEEATERIKKKIKFWEKKLQQINEQQAIKN